MGLFLPVRLKYWFYLLNLRIIHLKVPFPGNTEKVWTFPSHSSLSVISYYNQRSFVTSCSVESSGDDVSLVVGTFLILLKIVLGIFSLIGTFRALGKLGKWRK